MKKDFYRGKEEEIEEKEDTETSLNSDMIYKKEKIKSRGKGKKLKRENAFIRTGIIITIIAALIILIYIYTKNTEVSQRNAPTPTPTYLPSPTPSYYERKWSSHMKLLRNIVLAANSSYETKDLLDNKHAVLLKFIELFSISKNSNIEEADNTKIMNTLIDNLKNKYDVPYPEVYIYLYYHRLLNAEDEKNIKERAYKIVKDIKNYKLKEQRLKDLLEDLIKTLNSNIKNLNKEIKERVRRNNISYFDKVERNYLLKEINIGTDFEEDIKNLLWFLDPDELTLSGERWSEDIPENKYYKNKKEYFVKLRKRVRGAINLIY